MNTTTAGGVFLEPHVAAAADLLRSAAALLENWGDQDATKISAARLASDAVDALFFGDQGEHAV